jgi:hypothetical protein
VAKEHSLAVRAISYSSCIIRLIITVSYMARAAGVVLATVAFIDVGVNAATDPASPAFIFTVVIAMVPAIIGGQVGINAADVRHQGEK